MEIQELFATCADITVSKGFNVSQHLTQTLLIATEVGEAVQELGGSHPHMLQHFRSRLLRWMIELEEARADTRNIHHEPDTRIVDLNAYLEEYADILIRVASYVGGNGWTEEFMEILQRKIEKNRGRPFRHGKGF